MVGIWVLLIAWTSHALAARDSTLSFSHCLAVTQSAAIPAEIKRKERPTVEGEINQFGYISRDRVPKLGDGTHVYLIARLSDGQEILLHSPGAPYSDFKQQAWVVTHRSLEKLLPEGAVVIGGGEIRMIDGKVNEINNGASTYPGGREHLLFAARWLKGRGLPVEPTTTLRDYSVEGEEGRDHQKASVLAKVATTYRAYSFEPHILITNQMRSILLKKFQAPGEAPGEMDFSTFDFPKHWGDAELTRFSKLTTLMRLSGIEGPEYALEMTGGSKLMPLAEKNDTRAIGEYSKELLTLLIDLRKLAREMAAP